MPKVFNDGDRNIIRENLIRYGLEALEHGGYKAASIEAIARKAGIAKGTFYNFFQSKEHFFFEIMLSIRDENRKDICDFVSSGKCNKENMEDFLFERYMKRKNVYHYFTPDVQKIIFRKMPGQLSATSLDSSSLAAGLFSKIPNVNPNLNSEVVVNILNMMGSYAANNELLPVDSQVATMRFLANALASYIFEGVK